MDIWKRQPRQPRGFMIVVFVFSFDGEESGEVYSYFTNVFTEVSEVPCFFDVQSIKYFFVILFSTKRIL